MRFRVAVIVCKLLACCLGGCGAAPAVAHELAFTVSGPSQVQIGRPIKLHVDFHDDMLKAEDVVLEFRPWRQSDAAAFIQIDNDTKSGLDANVWADTGRSVTCVFEIEIRATLRTDAKVRRTETHMLTVDSRQLPTPPLPSPPPVPPKPPAPPTPPVPTPTPPTPPVPPTPPTPPAPDPIPEGEFGIGPKVAQIVSTVNDPNRVATAATLADRCDVLASQVSAGTVTNAQEVLSRIGEALKELGAPWQASAQQFASALQLTYEQHKKDRLALTTTGAFKDKEGWTKLLRECRDGLRRAK